MKKARIFIVVILLCGLAYGVRWYWQRADVAARGMTALLSRLPVRDDTAGQALPLGSGIYWHDTLVANLRSIRKIPFSVGDRDTVLLLSGEWLQSAAGSIRTDTSLSVVVGAVPRQESLVSGTLRQSRQGVFVGVVSLSSPRIILRLLLSPN